MNYWNLPLLRPKATPCQPKPLEKEYLSPESKKRAEELEKARREYKKKKEREVGVRE